MEIDESKAKEILFKIKYIIIGKTIKKTISIPKTPLELFIIPMLDDTAFKESLTDAPTKGTKLLIANRAVFNEIVSALCAKTFFNEKTKVKIDIIKTVIEVNIVRVDFENPENSYPPIDLMQLKIIDSFIKGNMNFVRQLLITAIKSIIEVFKIAALEIFPLIISIDVIMGTKEFIDSQSAVRYVLTYSPIVEINPKTLSPITLDAQKLKANFKLSFFREDEIM